MIHGLIGLFVFGCVAVAAQTEQPDYDIAILGGRVIDPETGLDAIRNVGIRGDKIVAVSEAPMTAATLIDASGRVVSPGFIDMHAHGQSLPAARMQALDGVTTALELEAGVLPVADFYDERATQGRPINYGAAVNWANARIAALMDKTPQADPAWFMEQFSDPGWQTRLATAAQLERIEAMVQEGLDQGALGVGFLLGYAPGTGRKEYHRISELAARNEVPTFTHARFLSMLEPDSSFEAMAEIVAAAAGTGVHAHIVHLNSMSLRDIEIIGPMLMEAREQGVRISTEAYPYGAGSTGVGAAMFRGPDWRERVGGVTAANFDVDGTRLTEQELARLQREAPGTQIVIHFLDTEDPEDQRLLNQSVLFPDGVIASDGGDWTVAGEALPEATWPLPETAWSHPRSAGTYARFIRQYVREQQAISLLKAIERVSYGPAKILQQAVPQLRSKGRIQPGADADIVIFDLAQITDNATYATPARASGGIEQVLVNGVLLVADGELNPALMPGRPVRNKPR
ncbi:amidohydrolase family protein [Kineobactrum salinum]|uniref:Amidohydrolase family protein n=1 Tax=Kineobactrum salinum TaxID=2708301 RepID=A0A6C0U6F4_9GAMM|nr:amidohydrolase family protein [Kineobactrum salinum]